MRLKEWLLVTSVLVPMLGVSVFADESTKNISLGQIVDGEWFVRACHPASKELTLTRWSNEPESVRIGLHDTVFIRRPLDGYHDTINLVTLVNFIPASENVRCGGSFVIQSK